MGTLGRVPLAIPSTMGIQASALFATSMFAGKELPLSLLTPGPTVEYRKEIAAVKEELALLESEQSRQEAGLQEIKPEEISDIVARKDKLNDKLRDLQTIEQWHDSQTESSARIWLMFNLQMAIVGGIAGWYFTAKIDRVQDRLSELEEQTTSKTLMYEFLRDIFDQKIPPTWILSDLVEAIERWANKSGPFQVLVREVGALHFSSLILGRAQQLGLLRSFEEFKDDEYIERFTIIGGSVNA